MPRYYILRIQNVNGLALNVKTKFRIVHNVQRINLNPKGMKIKIPVTILTMIRKRVSLALEDVNRARVCAVIHVIRATL
jgi:hypothetical protein